VSGTGVIRANKRVTNCRPIGIGDAFGGGTMNVTRKRKDGNVEERTTCEVPARQKVGNTGEAMEMMQTSSEY